MKLKHFAPLALIAPLMLLAACGSGTTTLTFTPYWYNNPANATIPGTNETLTYDVTFEAPASQQSGDFRVEYETGTYTTKLETDSITVRENAFGESSDGGRSDVYHYTTTLSITGRYYVNNQRGEDFTNEVKNEVWFFGASTADYLRPVRSVRTVKNYLPDINATSVADAYTLYEYTMTTDYNIALTRAKVTYDDLTTAADDNDEPVTVKINGSGTFLDEAQLLFALRGINLASGFTARTLNPVRRNSWSKATVSTNGAVTWGKYGAKEQNNTQFTLNGTLIDGEEIPSYQFSIAYSGNYAGAAQSLTYATMNNDKDGKTLTANTYRNVLLQKTEELPYGLGTLTTTLKEANFTR